MPKKHLAGPPPAAERPGTASPTPPPPPPARNYHRSKVATPQPAAPDALELLDLELGSGWFAANPLVLPRALAGLNYKTSYLRSTGAGGSRCERTLTVRLPDLAIASYVISWQNDNVATATAKAAMVRALPLAHALRAELESASAKFGEYVAAWSEHNFDKQVGTGECWDLAQQALLKGCGKHAFVLEYYHHGFPILTMEGGEVAQHDEVRRGDILQFKSCVFEEAHRVQTVGLPDHTAVVLAAGERLAVAEQNVNGVRRVVRGEYNLAALARGRVVVYRPMAAEWGGSL